MKNIIRISGVLILMITICISSCKKEETQPGTNPADEIVSHSTKVIMLIKNFDKKMKSTLKEDEQIELDSAVWNVEALQNYTYAFPDSSTRDFYVFHDYYTLDVDVNNKVWLSDVQELNDEMESDYQSNLNSLQTEVKLMHFCDVVLDSIAGSTAYISAISGFGVNLLLNTYWNFHEDDDWIWGTLSGPPAGKCDNTLQGVSDGSNELQWRLNNPLTSSQPGGYTDLETIDAIYSDFDPIGGTYRIYVDVFANLYNCIEDEGLGFYLYEADDIIYEYQPDGLRPTGKSFISIEIVDDLEFVTYNYIHRYRVTYGSLYSNPE